MDNTNVQLFSNPQFGNIRIVMNENGEPMFCLADACDILGLSAKGVNQRLTKDVISNYPLETKGGIQQVLFVNEDGLYDVVLDSRKPEAKQFRKWVTSEVLPSIRKHGAYMTPDTLEKAILSPDFIIKLATNLKEEQQKRSILEKENAILKPKAALMDKVIDTGEKIDIGQTAKILGLPYGRNTLFKKLRELGVFFKNRNEPKQEYVDRKYFELKEQWIERNTHDSFMIVKVLVTQKGLEFINRILDGNKSDGRQLKIA